MIKGLIFWDWTGTLADESALDHAVCRAMEEAIAHQKQLSRQEATQLFQAYLRQLEGTWPWHDYLLHARHFNLDWRQPQEKNLHLLRLLPGTEEVLRKAKSLGYLNILATNAVRAVIELRLQKAGIKDLLDDIITSDQVEALKSSGRHFLVGLQKWSVSPAQALSVGDNPIQDILSAQQVGLKTVYAVFGENLTHYHSPHISANHRQRVQADFQIHSLLEIIPILASENILKEAVHE